MARRELQEINAGSMADIAFLLLIFFLVSTTMDTDMGIVRKLPPLDDSLEQEDIVIKERNIFVVLVNKDDQLLVEGEWMQIGDLRNSAKEFIKNPANRDDLPAKEAKTVDYFGTQMITTKHVISLQNDRGTSYKTYIAVQNELAAAYNELRDELTMNKWGIKYEDLDPKDDEQNRRKEAVDEIYPMKISEAEPKNIGG